MGRLGFLGDQRHDPEMDPLIPEGLDVELLDDGKTYCLAFLKGGERAVEILLDRSSLASVALGALREARLSDEELKALLDRVRDYAPRHSLS